LLLAFLGSCSDDPAPEYSAAPLFDDGFDADARLDKWDQRTGRVSVVGAPDAPSPGNVLRAESLSQPQRGAATVRKTLKPGSGGIVCRFRAKLTKFAGDNYLPLARIDVAGGTVLFDAKEGEWHYFLKFGSQELAESGTLPMVNRWVAAEITIENEGKVIVGVDGATARRQIDTAVSPIDVNETTVELGLVAPPASGDTGAEYDSAVCTAR
jgi:hypothetical protein